ncbi:MAG: hypothetical protein EA409_06210 [Saprospirales bacterium]|nr:MAG: hypothetical protein EA409_06210 [Saprospirales bacterium]
MRVFSFIVFVCIGVFASGCFENEDYFVPDGHFTYVGDVQKLKSQLKPEGHVINLTELEGDSAILIDGGVTLMVNPENFLDGDGSPYEGEIELYVIPTEKITDWVGFDQSFMGENGLIDLLFALNIKIDGREGRPAFINIENAPKIRLESNQTDRQLNYFDQMDQYGIYGQWSLNEENKIVPDEWMEEDETGQPVLKTGFVYTLLSSGWHAIGQESNLVGEVSVCFELPPGFTSGNTTTFLVLRNINSVVQLREWKDRYTSCNTELLIPRDEAIDVVSISRFSGERYFLSFQTVIADQDQLLIHLNPKRASWNSILDKVNSRN